METLLFEIKYTKSQRRFLVGGWIVTLLLLIILLKEAIIFAPFALGTPFLTQHLLHSLKGKPISFYETYFIAGVKGVDQVKVSYLDLQAIQVVRLNHIDYLSIKVRKDGEEGRLRDIESHFQNIEQYHQFLNKVIKPNLYLKSIFVDQLQPFKD